ncbi:hypothetical protein H257_03998 [Aphanomyces astaci]|uniref:CHCH domain-containing protein n=1 Tax=Aphanomyces astaci TaxID=112090 RepID=W4GW14_APHAT|nr:hypothetical protein H257_03998 [Aphanomyces astaci]ETV83214.1 hypothetical protein H257_03998 [Aphanomyces astaci]|eukprot:XP_009826644.1 hypothetical protein H257_03998 [Aphanomyces astaci]
MARSRSSASSPRRSVPAAKPAAAPAVQQSAPAPAQVQSGGGLGSGLLSTVAEGMAFGTGSAMAHRAVGAIANSIGGSNDKTPATTTTTTATAPTAASSLSPPESNSCFNDHKAFLDCLQTNKNDVASCQFYFDQFNMCKSQTTF